MIGLQDKKKLGTKEVVPSSGERLLASRRLIPEGENTQSNMTNLIVVSLLKFCQIRTVIFCRGSFSLARRVGFSSTVGKAQSRINSY